MALEENSGPRVSLLIKFFFGFGLLAAMSFSLVLVGTSTIDLSARLLHEAVSVNVEQLNRVNHILSMSNGLRRMETDLGHLSDYFIIAGACDEIEHQAKVLDSGLTALASDIHKDNHRHREILLDAWRDYRNGLLKATATARENRMKAVEELSIHETFPKFAVLVDHLGVLSTEINARSEGAKNDALNSLRNRRILFFVLAGSGLVLYLSAGLIMWRSIVNRIRNLRTEAESLTDGGTFSQPEALFGKDEINELGEILAEMAEKIKNREKRLQEAHDEMGERVLERTRELAQANESLLTEARERKEAEEEALLAREHYHRLFDATTDGVLVLDEHLDVVDMNRAAASLLGPRESRAGTGFGALLGEDCGFILDALRDCLQGETSFLGEAKARRGDDSYFPAEVKAVPFTADSGRSLLVTVKDVTQRKAAEEDRKNLELRLARSEKMEALGLLAGGVAHDLNNVLSPVVAYPDLLLMDLKEEDKARRMVERIQAGALKASAIVQDLLALARRGVTVREPVYLNGLVKEYQIAFENNQLALKKSIRLVLSLEDGLLPISGSPVHLYKVILNIAQNAVEASGDHSLITIKTENRHLDHPRGGLKSGDYTVLTISDEGCGIAPEHLTHIFEPFYSRKAMGHSGTGLGMAVVWGAVQDHEGHIEVVSELGKGTTFTVHFPALDAITEGAAVEKSGELPMGKGELILVVDDMDSQRELAVSILVKLGYSAVAVDGGREALNWLSTNNPDLVVLDMIMGPEMDGLDTFREAKKLRPTLKAIICSGFAESGRVKKTQELGAGKYIRKPFTMELLARVVREELDRQ